MPKKDSKSSLQSLTPEVMDQIKKRPQEPKAGAADQKQVKRMLKDTLTKPGRSTNKVEPSAKDTVSNLLTKNTQAEVREDADLSFAVSVETPKSEIIKTLEACIQWLNANENTLNDEAVRLIDERLQSNAKKSQVFFVVAIQKRMDSLVRLLEAADRIELRMLDPNVIDSMEPDELRKSLELIEKKSDSIMKQIAVMIESSSAFPKQFFDESRVPKLESNGTRVFEDPLKRDQVRLRLDTLLKKAKDD
jgi:hypothetical protein